MYPHTENEASRSLLSKIGARERDILDIFSCCDFDLYAMTLIDELDLHILKVLYCASHTRDIHRARQPSFSHYM